MWSSTLPEVRYVHVGCFSHVRDKLVEVLKILPPKKPNARWA